MEITGIITHVLPVESGVSQNTGNEWKRQTVVLRTEEQYPKDVAINLNKNHIDSIAVGEKVTFSINITSREYQGKWYTQVEEWKINKQPQAQAQVNWTAPPPITAASATTAAIPPQPGGFQQQSDDLPF